MKTIFTAAAAAVALLAVQAPAFAEDLEFLLVNEGSANLVEFNVSPASSGNWEENLLDGGVLESGYEVGVLIADGATTCVYDIRGGFADGSEAEDYGLDLCELGEYSFID